MVITARGVRNVDFETDKGERMVGVSLYFSYTAEGVEGEVCEKRFISASMLGLLELEVGANYNAQFNTNGKLVSI